MTERRVYIAQCLCGPNRHAILAVANEFDDEAAAQELLPKLRAGVADVLQLLNPWCAICGSPEGAWRYELGRTRFRSMEEAGPNLAKIEAENALANVLFGSHGPARPKAN